MTCFPILNKKSVKTENKEHIKLHFLYFKIRLHSILNDPPHKEVNEQFTTAPFLALTDHKGQRTPCVHL